MRLTTIAARRLEVPKLESLNHSALRHDAKATHVAASAVARRRIVSWRRPVHPPPALLATPSLAQSVAVTASNGSRSGCISTCRFSTSNCSRTLSKPDNGDSDDSTGKASQPAPLQLTLYTAPHCSLCTDLLDILSTTVSASHQTPNPCPPYTLQLYNIRDDTLPNVHAWRRAYQYEIPVLHCEGKEIARHRLVPEKFLEEMRKAAAERVDSVAGERNE